MTFILLLISALCKAGMVAAATIDANVIVRIETSFLTETPGGEHWSVYSCKIDKFVDNCIANNIGGVAVELKRSDVSDQLGHLYFDSSHANTEVYTGKGYNESLLFELLRKLRLAQIKTFAWWPVFNDAVLAAANSTNALHRRIDFGSTDPNSLKTSTQFVSVHSNEVRQHQLEMIDKILTHPNMTGWDGIRLDYIRFNYDEDDFSEPARARYSQLYGSDPLQVVTSNFDEPWKSFRRDEITAFLQEATTLCHSHDPTLDVGGYLLPFAASPGGFDVYQGQGNDFTQYHSFNFRALPMIYFQDWSDAGNFEEWTKEKVYWAVNYTTDTPAVIPTFSITNTKWCGDESCHRQYILDAFLIAANAGKDVISYESRTVEMFYYYGWGKVEWDRLAYSLTAANDIINSGTAAPTPSPDPNECTHFVPCGYTFYPGKDTSGYEWGTDNHRNIPAIANDCDADSGCLAFNSDSMLKWYLEPESEWENKWTDPCLGLYVKDTSTPTTNPTTLNPTPGYTPGPSTKPSSSPITVPNPTKAPTNSPTSEPTSTSPTLNPTIRPSPSSVPTDNPVSSCPPVPNGYEFHPQVDTPGHQWGPFNQGNIPAIANDCDADSGCLAFNSNGYLKWYILGEANWQEFTSDPCSGFYTKIISAYDPLICTFTIPSGYNFYPGKDSEGCAWGPFNANSIPAITNDCDADGGCIGFNSNGWLKSCVQPENKWVTWTVDPCRGLFVQTS